MRCPVGADMSHSSCADCLQNEGSLNSQHLHVLGSPLIGSLSDRQADLHFTVEDTKGPERLRNLPRAAQLMSSRGG